MKHFRLFLILAALPMLAQSPYPGGTISNKPDTSVETETEQVGGKGWNWYTYVGALRCGSGEAMVGIYSRRGSILDYVQLACATVTCQNGTCGWKTYRWGMGKGDPKGGSIANQDVCPVNYIVAGFRGGSAGSDSYATDLQVECALLDGRSAGGSPRGMLGQRVFGVFPKGQLDDTSRDKRGNFGRTGTLRYTAPSRSYTSHAAFSSSDNQRLCSCAVAGATGLSIAIGRWNMVYQAVQAYSLFCARDGSKVDAVSCRMSSDR